MKVEIFHIFCFINYNGIIGNDFIYWKSGIVPLKGFDWMVVRHFYSSIRKYKATVTTTTTVYLSYCGCIRTVIIIASRVSETRMSSLSTCYQVPIMPSEFGSSWLLIFGPLVWIPWFVCLIWTFGLQKNAVFEFRCGFRRISVEVK